MAQPQPAEWIRAYAQTAKLSDAEILRIIEEARQDVTREINRIVQAGGLNPSDAVRLQQYKTIRAALMAEQAQIFRRLGDVVQAARLEAAVRAMALGDAIDAAVFERFGKTALAKEVAKGLTYGLTKTLDVAMARMELSYTGLSKRIYETRLWMDGRLDKMINSALARGLTASQFAKEAESWFNPNTPGGIRYAAQRLARTEINNAFHAMAVQQANEKPWVNAMKWHLSSSHPKPDECDQYAHDDKYNMGAGVFPKTEVPRKPHPQCFCYVTPEVEDEDEFLDNLTGGKYDKWVEKERAKAEGRETARDAPRPPVGGSGGPKRTYTPPTRPATPARPKIDPALDRAIQHAKNINRTAPALTARVGKALQQQAVAAPRSMAKLKEVRGEGRGSAYERSWTRDQDPNTGAYYRWADEDISLSPGWVDDPAAYQSGFRRLPDDSKWFSRSELPDSLESTIAHEYGHHIEGVITNGNIYWSGPHAKQWTEALRREYKGVSPGPTSQCHASTMEGWWESNRDAFKSISRYGASNMNEFIAEIWAEYTTGGAKCRPKVKRLGQLLAKMAEEIA